MRSSPLQAQTGSRYRGWRWRWRWRTGEEQTVCRRMADHSDTSTREREAPVQPDARETRKMRIPRLSAKTAIWFSSIPGELPGAQKTASRASRAGLAAQAEDSRIGRSDRCKEHRPRCIWTPLFKGDPGVRCRSTLVRPRAELRTDQPEARAEPSAQKAHRRGW